MHWKSLKFDGFRDAPRAGNEPSGMSIFRGQFLGMRNDGKWFHVDLKFFLGDFVSNPLMVIRHIGNDIQAAIEKMNSFLTQEMPETPMEKPDPEEGGGRVMKTFKFTFYDGTVLIGSGEDAFKAMMDAMANAPATHDRRMDNFVNFVVEESVEEKIND